MIRVPRKESQTIHPTQQLSGWALSHKRNCNILLAVIVSRADLCSKSGWLTA